MPLEGKTGVLIYAMGHAEYGSLAANLAMSIKSTDANMPIHLVWHGNALSRIKDRMRFFDTTEECPVECLMKNGFIRYFRAKTCMYDLSPFDNTIFLDADVVMFANRSIFELVLNELSDVDFTIQNRGRFDLKEPQKQKYFWAQYKDVQDKYKDYENHYLYSLHSEFVWFKRTDANKAMFDRMKEIYDHPPIHPEIFAGDVADEFTFALAGIEQNRHPHKTPFPVLYWQQLDKNDGLQIPDIQKKYWGFSAGGNSHPKIVEQNYNILARAYASKFGVMPFLLKKKKGLMPERARM